MTTIPPTTVYEVDKPDASPCCDAPLELVSPPIGYECRECMQAYTLDESDGDGGETYTCAGNDGACSREVDEEGGYCWQHSGD